MPVGDPLLVRPHSPGDVLDRAAALVVRRNFPQALKAVLISYLPFAVLLQLPMVPATERISVGLELTQAEFHQYLMWVAVWLIGDVVLLRQFTRGWLFAIVGADLRGVTVSNRQAAAFGLRRMPSASIATLLTFGPFLILTLIMSSWATGDEDFILLGLIFGLLVFMIGMPLAVFGYCATAIAVLERRGPFAAVGRSFRLAASGAGVLLLVVLVQFIIHLFGELMPSMIPNLWVQSLFYATAVGLLTIFDTAVEAVLYFTIRCEREDYDLELLAREVELYAAEELEVSRPTFDRLTFGFSSRDDLAESPKRF